MNPFRDATGGGDERAIVAPTEQRRRMTAAEFKEWAKFGVWCLCVMVLIVFFAGGVAHFIALNVTKERIKCYECITFNGVTVTEPGLPYEKNCKASPKNWRECNIGEQCAMIHISGGGMSRFHRSCTVQKKRGCSAAITTVHDTVEKYCYCNTDYCRD